MIHILLLILKIIGILLLAVITLALLVLFFPVFYKGHLQCSESKCYCRINAGWLFHIIHLTGRFDGKMTQYSVRVFGIPVVSSNKKNSKKKKSGKKKKDIQRPKGLDEAPKADEKETKERVTEDRETKERVTNSIHDNHRAITTEKKKRKFTDRVKNFFKRIKNKIRKITHNIKKSNNKWKEIKAFIQAKTTKAAWKYGKNIIIKLVKHILPKRVRADIRFGLGEPHVTGEAFGVIAMVFGTFGINPKYIVMEPDFENSIVDGEARCRGYILLGVVGFYILKLYFNKDIRLVIDKVELGGIYVRKQESDG